ncbi:MAG: fibronectin type III domain-containing protein [Lachnospiraceae bacterium]|nr:fibronectin type III domain-containing protein [Lachnospiraceae bacterium]
MNGDGAQKIDFAQNEPGASRIANLEIQNDSEDGVTIGGNHATVTGTITDNGHYIKGWVIPGASATITDNIYHGNLYLHVAKTIGFPLVVEGTVSQDTNITFNADVTIKGGYSLSSSYAYLNGHEMHVEGNVTISSSGYYYQSYLVLQGGKMICEGNLTVNNSYTHITMNNANDYIYVGGNCTISSSVSSTMSAGTIELKGDFAQTGTYNNIQASGSHKVLLSGDRKQTVTIENISIMLNILELNNTSNDGVYFSSANIPARQVIKNETKIHINGIGVFGWKLTEDTVIEGDVYVVSDVLDLNGHTLKISGNLYIGSGKLFINGGELIVEKDLRFQSITTNADNEVTSYANSSSYFDMTNDNDIVTVGGNFVMQSTYDINGMLTKGVLEIKGNFVQNNGSNYNFRSTGSHTVVLSGAQEQTITFANPSSTYSYFNNLKIENTSSKGVVLKSNIYVNGYLDDANTKISKSSYSTFLKNIDNLKGDSFGGNIYMENAATLKRDLTVLGSFGANKNVNLNGYSLTTGSYTQSEGTLTIGGGNLNVVGSLSIGNYGYLNMTNAQDYVCVTGNFTTDSYYSHDNYLKEGTLEIRGDFKQTRTGNFTASGNHTTVLSGKTGTANRNYVQIITFAAEGSGKFNHLVLNKAKSLYLFTPAIDKICNDYVNEAKDDEAPSKVMDVTVTNKEATKVSLSWLPSTDNETVTGYEIYRGNVKVGTTSKTTFVDSGLTPSTTYIYKVCAFDEMRNVSTESDPITVTTLEDTDAPSVPSGVKVKSKTGTAITITWNASSDNVSVKGYIVYRKGEEIARLGNETLYRDADVEKDELYTYSIRAYDAAGNESHDSEEVKGSLAMPEITKVEPKNNASIGGGSTTITVYYKNSGNSVGNKVKFEYQSENDAGEKVWEQIGGVTYGQQTYNSTTLYSRCIWDYMNVKNGECKMRITLYDADGNTDTETFSYIIDTEGPIPTDDIRAKSSDGVVTVSWSESDSADCVKYKVFRAEGENSDYVLVATVNDNEYSDKNVEEGKTYFYKVSGLDNYGQEGEKSESAKVTISTDEAAPEVTGISVKNKRINKVTKVKVTGSDNLKLATLSLEYQNPKDEEWIGIDGTTKEVTNNEAVFDFDTTELSDGKYKLRAIATDAAGNKSAGHISYGGLEMDLDPYYADVVIDNTGIEKIVVNDAKAYATYVTLKWNNVSEDDFSYFVVEQLKGDKYEQVARINTTLGAHIQNLDSDTAYTFRVVGYDNLDNRGIPSDEIVLTTKEDREAPIVKSFYPANKYYKDSIPLSLNVTDNSGVKSLRLTYSTDRKEWKDITTITLDKAEKSYTFKHSFDVYDIPEGTVYVRAFAYDEMGNESNADGEPIENNFEVDRTAPSEVMNVVAEGMSGYNSITWKKAPESDGVREFRLYRALEEVGNYTLIASGITTNIYYDTTAVAGEVYTYKVLAVDEAGNIGDFSAEAVAQSRKDDEAPVVHALTPATNSKVTGTTNIKAIVSDNSSVQNVTFEFKSADSEEDVWTEIATVAVGKSVGYPAVDWDVSNFENKKYIVRVTASDYMNNISNTFTAEYVVDTVAPTAPELSVTGIGYGAKLSWIENKEDDFDHYEVYRKLGGEEEFELITRLDDNTYEDKNLKPDRKYIYKVYAYDEVGNFASSSEVAVTPTSEDTEAPVAVVSEDMSVRQGSELLLDGTASHDNVKVGEYKWDMGNGDVVYGPIVRYRYKEMGTYKAKLTVTDAAGNSDTTPITVRVRSRISAKVDFKVINKSGSNNYIMSYSYIYIENDGVGENYRADSYGELSVVLSAGTYTVDVYKEGYMPKSYRITVANGDEQVQTLEIEKGELVTGELTTTRLTLQQIIDLGVDLQDPNNWYTYTYKMTYTVPGTPVKKTQNINLYPGTVTKVSRGDGGGINGGGYYYVSMVDVEGKKVVTVYETVSFLKKMYDVKLLVTNNAEDGYGFDIVDSTATLNLPGGLSLLKISTPQYLTNDLGTLHAQETKETHWYIRADEPGSYDLSATFNGTLMPFEAPVNTVISADEPLEVTPEEDNTFTDDGFASNPTDYVLRIVDKHGNRVKGAIVTLSCGGKQCQTITNSRGTARLEVNRGDTRTFNLSVVHDDFILYNQSYNIKTDYYTDTITLYRPGESEDDDEGEYTDRKNPYLEGYDIGMSAATFNGASIIYFTKYINRLVNKNHTLDFTFTENINKYELTLNGKTIDMGETDSDTLSISFSGGDFEEEGRLALTVYGEEKSATYKLNVYVEKRLFDKVMLKDKTVFVDLLTETYNIYTSDQDTTYEITCNILDEAKSAATSFVLVQEDEEAVTSDNGVFEVRSGHFEPFKPIYLIAFDGEEVVTKDRLYLNVIKAIDSDFELKIGTDELSYKVSSDIPILGGCEISFDLGDYELPYDIEYNSEGCKITVGNTLGEGEGACKLFTIIPGKLSMALDVSGSLYGNYESTKFEGSLELKFTITGEWEQQLPITFPVVIAIEATGEFGATGKLALDLTEESKEKISGALELAMSLGLDVFAGIGVAETVSAGIYGKATFNASMDLLPKTQGNKVSLEGDLGVRFKLFNMKTDFSILSGEYIIYDREHPELVGKGLKGMTVDEIKNHIYDMKNYYYPVPEDNEKTQEWLGESLSGTENDIQVIQDGIDSDANPVMVDAKGKTLLLFNSKDSNDDIYNESRVVYSVYDNGKFTKPEYVDASDKAQFGFDVFESDGETYIIWQEAAKRFTEDDTLDIVAKSVELKAAKWDGTKFVSLGTITDNEKCELKPQICASNGKIYAVWYENSEDDIFEQKGTDTVYCAEYADGEWSTKKLAAELQGINSMDAGKVDDSMYVAYASTGTDCMIDLSDGESAEYALDARNVQFGIFTDNKVLTWNENGTLYYADKKNEAAYVLCGSSLLKECGYSYISDNNGNYSIVFTKTVDGKAQLYVSDYDMETNQWGEPQAVTTQDYYIENVAGIYVNNRLLTVFNQTQASVTKDNVSVDSDLCFMEIGKHDKVSINEVTFDNSEVMPGGNVRLNIDLANNGLKTVSAENINITVKDENGKVKAEAKGTKSVKAGTSEIQEVIINLPFTLSVSAYTVEVTCGESTAIKSISMGYADLCVSAKVSVNHDVYEVVSTVENLGIEAASGKLVFYDKDNADRVFDEKPIRELNYGESATITYVVDDSVYNKAESASIGVRIETEEDQVTTDNDKTSVFISNSATGVPCRVVFDYADGKNDLRAVYITSNTVIKLPKTPEKEGYTFIGWFDGDEKYTQDSIVSKDIKLIAKYEKNTESETSSEVVTTKPGTAGSNVETTKPGTAGSNVEAAKPGTAGNNVEAAKPDTAGNNAQASALSEQNAGKLKATSIKKITAKKKALAVKWKKVAGAKGYKLQYSLNKKFSKAKTVNIKKSSSVSKVIKKLKSNKKYYIRIRYYKVSGGKTYLSKWSKVKSKKTR